MSLPSTATFTTDTRSRLGRAREARLFLLRYPALPRGPPRCVSRIGRESGTDQPGILVSNAMVAVTD